MFSPPLLLEKKKKKGKVTACTVSYVVMTPSDGLHIKSLASLRMLPVESFYGILKIATEGENEKMDR